MHRPILVWQMYTGINIIGKTISSENFLDSFLILTNIALSFDDQLAEAYRIRGDYYDSKMGKMNRLL